jgi:hypothetical protein
LWTAGTAKVGGVFMIMCALVADTKPHRARKVIVGAIFLSGFE